MVWDPEISLQEDGLYLEKNGVGSTSRLPTTTPGFHKHGMDEWAGMVDTGATHLEPRRRGMLQCFLAKLEEVTGYGADPLGFQSFLAEYLLSKVAAASSRKVATVDEVLGAAEHVAFGADARAVT
jgi:hypothetical protein